MNMLKRIIAKFIPAGKQAQEPCQMLDCFGPINLPPEQIDFGTVYICRSINSQTPDTFFAVRHLLFQSFYCGFSQDDFRQEADKIHPNVYRFYLRLTLFDQERKLRYTLGSKINNNFIDDLCCFIWKLGNTDWSKIAYHMYNGITSEVHIAQIKTIYRNMCNFKVPKDDLSSLFTLLDECPNIGYNSVRAYMKIKRIHIFETIIQNVNINPVCLQNAVRFTQIMKHSFLTSNESKLCIQIFSLINTDTTKNFIQMLYFRRVYSRLEIESCVPKRWLPANFFVEYSNSENKSPAIAREKKLINDLSDRKAEIEKLKQKTEERKNDFHQYEKIIKKLKEDNNELKKQNLILEKKVREYNDNDYFIIKQEIVQSRYPILHAILSYFLFNHLTPSLKMFSAVLLMMGSKAYRYIQKALPIYGETSCYNIITPGKQMYSQYIQDAKYINFMLDRYYGELLDDPNKPLYATLAGDAAQLTTPILNNNIYLYVLLPLDHTLPILTLHVKFTKAGASSKYIVQYYDTLCSILEKRNIVVKYKATDGDTSFDGMHSKFFNENIFPNWDTKTFAEVVHHSMNCNKLPVSDLLHILKCARAHLLGHLIMVEPHKGLCVNLEELKKAVELGAVIDDNSKAGRQKDGYVLKLFSWEIFIKCLNKERFDAAFYLMPFVFLTEAVRSNSLSRGERMSFLEIAFIAFKLHYENLVKLPKNKLFPQEFKRGSIGTQFGSTVFLQRCINTCISFAVALNLGIQNLGFERIGTHPVECLFGKMRICSHFDHSVKNALSALSGALLLKELLDRLPIKFTIKKRDNTGGAHLPIKMEIKEEIKFDPVAINNAVFALLNQIPYTDFDLFNETIEKYSKRLSSTLNSSKIHIPSVLSGLNPTSRYINKTYLMSTLPIINDDENNILEGYKGTKKYSLIASNQEFNEWSNTLKQRIDELLESLSAPICPEDKNLDQQNKDKEESNERNTTCAESQNQNHNLHYISDEFEKRETVIQVFLSSGYNPEKLITPVIKDHYRSIAKSIFSSPYHHPFRSGHDLLGRKTRQTEANNIKYIKDPKLKNIDLIDNNIPDTLSSAISYIDDWESTDFEFDHEIENFVL